MLENVPPALRTRYGAIGVWAGLAQTYDEAFLKSILNEFPPVADDERCIDSSPDEIRCFVAVLNEYCRIRQNTPSDGVIDDNGFVSGPNRDLREACRIVADKRDVGHKRVRQACASTVCSAEQSPTKQFLADAQKFRTQADIGGVEE